MLKIRYRHYHDGNDYYHAVRGTAIYATSAALVDTTTGDCVAEGWSYCNPHDSPSRKMGRIVALDRLSEELTYLDKNKPLISPGIIVLASAIKKEAAMEAVKDTQPECPIVPEQKKSTIETLI